jgi:hypothetical protein
MDHTEDDDQAFVARLLASTPPPNVSADFLTRVNARIDDTAGWFGLADFRVWTLRLAPAAAGFALIAVLLPGAPSAAPSTALPSATAPSAASFSPASATDWQREVSADALLDAALYPASGGVRGR